MLKEFVREIAGMANNVIHDVNGERYSDKPIYHVEKIKNTPDVYEFSSLESISKMIKTEVEKQRALPLIVCVKEHDLVEVFTTYDNDYDRDRLYRSFAQTPRNACIGSFVDHEDAMIMFRSLFEETPDLEYVLNLLTKITDDSSVSSNDNGLTQTIEAKKGISLLEKVNVRSRVALKPYRTFLEVEQPTSEFLLRVSEGGRIALFEADGGMWKIHAKKNIKEYFSFELGELIDAGKVILTI